jgi:hypothetical protein
VAQLRHIIAGQMAEHDGVLAITKDVGAFIARR